MTYSLKVINSYRTFQPRSLHVFLCAHKQGPVTLLKSKAMGFTKLGREDIRISKKYFSDHQKS